MILSKRIERLEQDSFQSNAPVIPESCDALIEYLQQSDYSFAPVLAEMLKGDSNEYHLGIVRSVLGSPDPEALYQTIEKIYGNQTA